jgi:hypothetical protein
VTAATEFFNQFPPLDDASDWADGQWCPRHWAPAALLGANGIGAAAELMAIFAREIAPPNMRSAAMLGRELAKAGRLCCLLGDERVYEVWARWQVAAEVAARPPA